MAHDPKAQDVIAHALFVAALGRQQLYAEDILNKLADAGLCVVSDAAESADGEQRAVAFEAAQHRQTFTDPLVTYMKSRHADGRCCGLRGCQCMERP